MKKLLLISLLLTTLGAFMPTENVNAQLVHVYQDLDGDTYWGKRNIAETGSTRYNNLIAQGYVPFADQNANFQLTKDCDDADNTVWNFVRIFRDADGDGFVADDVNNGTRVCIGNTLPAGYITLENYAGAYDCDDADPTVWRMIRILIDGDGDKWSSGGPGVVTCIGEAAPAGYITIFEVLGFNDCDPNDGTTWDRIGLLYDNDGDNHVVLGQPLTFFCIGNTLPANYILPENRQGITDCNDNDPTVWRNVCARPIDGPPNRPNSTFCIGNTWPAGFRQCGPDPAATITMAFSVYPNPATDRFYLMPEQDLNEKVEVKLMDSYGRVIRMVNAPNAIKGQNLSINTSDLKPGLYRVAIQSGTNIVSKTIAVKL